MRLFLFLPLFFLLACNQPASDPRTEVTALEEATMRVHDEAMAQMAEMKSIGRQLKKSLEQLDSTGQKGPRRDSLMLGIEAIDRAGRDMMDWMAGYTPPDKLPNEEALKYLTSEKAKIDKNKADIEAAKALGKSLLVKNQTGQ